uniref:Uncharacterized protein n=1 Tax=Corethron hystrix TaxID=216773 RepID=A0A7S1BLB2_9STRA
MSLECISFLPTAAYTVSYCSSSGHPASIRSSSRSGSKLNVSPVVIDVLVNGPAFIDSAATVSPFVETTSPAATVFGSSTLLLAEKDWGNLAKIVIISVAFGGGLIPALISANTRIIESLTRKGAAPPKEEGDPSKSLDPYAALPISYVSDSGASGPTLSCSPLLFSGEPVKLVDVLAVIGRISDVNDVARWSDLPSTKLPNVSSNNPPQWLPRNTYKVNIRAAKWRGWPVNADGSPIGGGELQRSEEKRLRQKGAEISDAALDVVFDTWALGAGVATPDKVSEALSSYLKSNGTFDLGKFQSAAVLGRAVTAAAILFFLVIQVIAFGTLFIAPFLRVFFGIDIGFGVLGACDGAICGVTLWPKPF